VTLLTVYTLITWLYSQYTHSLS